MEEKKFIWNGDKIRLLSSEESDKLITKKYTDTNLPYKECKYNRHCHSTCKYEDIASEIARALYLKHFNPIPNSFMVRINSIIDEVKMLLPKNIVLSKGLYFCIKVHIINICKQNNPDFDIEQSLLDEIFNMKKSTY